MRGRKDTHTEVYILSVCVCVSFSLPHYVQCNMQCMIVCVLLFNITIILKCPLTKNYIEEQKSKFNL